MKNILFNKCLGKEAVLYYWIKEPLSYLLHILRLCFIAVVVAFLDQLLGFQQKNE